MAYASVMPYNYAKRAGDPTKDTVDPMTNGAPQAGTQTSGPALYQPNQPQQRQVAAPTGAPSGAQPPMTFSQMQAAGYARPPMPMPSGPPDTAPPASGTIPGMLSGQAQAQQPTPATNAPASVAPSNGLPPGFTLGDSLAKAGNAFLNGQQLNGLVYDTSSPTGQSYSFVNGSIVPGATQDAWQKIIDAENANYYALGGPGDPAAGAILQATYPTNGGVNRQGAPVASGAQAAIPPRSPSGPNTDVTGAIAPMTLAGAAPVTSPASTTPTGQVGGGMTFPPISNGTPGGTDILGLLTGGATGNGAGSQVQSATQAAALKQLQNPSPYGSADVKNLYSWLAGNIQDQSTLGQRAIGEEMARRGLGTSTIHAGNLNDLNVGRRSAQETLGQDLAQQYAQTLGQYQSNAISQGNTVGNSAQQAQQSWLAQLMGYGQNAFQNDLATQQLNQNAAQNYQDYILKLLSLGYGG